MPQIIVPIDMLFDVAKEFSKAGKRASEMQAHLASRMKLLDSAWSDASKQQFSRYYRELDLQLRSSSQVMDTMARELQAIAEGYAKLERRTGA